MPENELDIRAIFGLLRRRTRLIVVTVIAIVTLAGLATFALTPIFTSTALVLVDPSQKNLLDPESALGSTASDSARVESEVELVRTDSVLMRVIQDLNLVSDPEFGVSLGLMDRLRAMLHLSSGELPTGDKALGEVLSKVRSAISVQRRGLTYLISVQARSESAARAAQLANSITQAYISEQLSSKISSTLASRDILQARIEQARQAIVNSEGSFDNFISENIDRIVAESGNSQIADLRNQIDTLKNARQQTIQTADIAQRSLQEENWDQLANTLASDAVRALEAQRDAVTSNLAAAASGSAAEIDLKSELDAIDAKLRDTATTELTALQDRINASQNSENELRQNIRNSVISSNLPSGVLTQIYELQQNAAIARTQYETLLGRAQDLGAQADLQVADSRVVSPALVPAKPSFPNPQLILLLSTIAALGVGVGLAFLYENFIGGFSSEEQIEAVLRTRVVSSIPRQRAIRPDQRSFADLVITSPISVYSESIRRIRAAVDRLVSQNTAVAGGKVIMVTSTAPSEGKTTAAVSLARSYALSGKRTLLIDCDMRKPSINVHLGLAPSEGLMGFLSGSESAPVAIDSILSLDPLSQVTVIAGARRSDAATDQLIAAASFARLIRAARQAFDVVVLDTPPIGPVVDGLYIAKDVDAILFVVRYSSTSQSDARKALANLVVSKGPQTEIVAVLNQEDISRQAYNSKYGSYYNEE